MSVSSHTSPAGQQASVSRIHTTILPLLYREFAARIIRAIKCLEMMTGKPTSIDKLFQSSLIFVEMIHLAIPTPCSQEAASNSFFALGVQQNSLYTSSLWRMSRSSFFARNNTGSHAVILAQLGPETVRGSGARNEHPPTET